MQYLHSLSDLQEGADGGHILWAAKAIEGYDIQKRVPHEEQSQAATKLLGEISLIAPFSVFRSSRSHCRALIATAVSDHAIEALGIDVESMLPKRAFDEILRKFAEGLPSGIEGKAFYRIWTFLEAHFKAFQSFPPPSDIQLALDHSNDDETWQTQGGVRVFQKTISDQFCLTLVWSNSKSSAIPSSH